MRRGLVIVWILAVIAVGLALAQTSGVGRFWELYVEGIPDATALGTDSEGKLIALPGGPIAPTGPTGPAGGDPNYGQDFSSVSSVVLTHNLDSVDVLTMCYLDATKEWFLPGGTVVTDANNVTVTFSSNQTGRCVVNGGGGAVGPTGPTGPSNENYNQAFSSVSSVTLTHNLGTLNVLTMCFLDSTEEWFLPGGTVITDNNNVDVTFGSAQSGRCVVNGGGGVAGPTGPTGATGADNEVGYVATFSSVSSVTVAGATHNLGRIVAVSCYDDSDPRNGLLAPWTYKDSDGEVVITFASNKSGKCVLV